MHGAGRCCRAGWYRHDDGWVDVQVSIGFTRPAGREFPPAAVRF
jgi:hypothetical protein